MEFIKFQINALKILAKSMQKIRKLLMFQKKSRRRKKKGIILTNTVVSILSLRSSVPTEDLNDSIETTVVIRRVILVV